MKVTLVYFDGCPNWQVADQRLHEALDQLGRHDSSVDYHQVVTPEQAESEQFRGSPTVLVDGVDPWADVNAEVGLSCRVFKTPDGLAGSPTVDQLMEVLR